MASSSSHSKAESKSAGFSSICSLGTRVFEVISPKTWLATFAVRVYVLLYQLLKMFSTFLRQELPLARGEMQDVSVILRGHVQESGFYLFVRRVLSDFSYPEIVRFPLLASEKAK